MQQRHGFTLMELMVVMGIIIILAAISLPIITMVRKQAKDALCRNNLQQIGIGITGFQQVNNNTFPQSLSQMFADNQPMSGESAKLLLCPFDTKKGTDKTFNRSNLSSSDISELYDPNHSNGTKSPAFTYPTFVHSYAFEAANVDLGPAAEGWWPGKGTWANAKVYDLKHGNLTEPFRLSDFPIVRCFWHATWPASADIKAEKRVLNLAWDMSLFWSIPKWEDQMRGN